MKVFVTACALLFLVLPPVLGGASEDFISVRAEVDKATVTIGERVEYRISVTHHSSIQLLSPVAPSNVDPFEIKEVHDFSEKQGALIVEGRRFVLTTYELGEFILDPVAIEYRTSGGERRMIQTNRLFLTVKSVDEGKPKTDIRNVKGTLQLKPRWGWVVLTLLMIAALGGGVYVWYRWKHRALAEPGAEEAKLSLEDETLLRLNRLFDSDLLRRGKMKEYFLELSEILRRYFERRFDILAVESTTTEILRDLKTKDLAPTLYQKIQQVLETADLVKFAKWVPTPPEIVRTNQLSKALVEEARPVAVLQLPMAAPSG